ncbi:hypothetical protein NN561_008004 [Cricetulus griseus]
MPGSDTALTVDRTYSDPGRHHRCKSRVRARSGRRGNASRWGGRGSSPGTHLQLLPASKVGRNLRPGDRRWIGRVSQPTLPPRLRDGVSPPGSARCRHPGLPESGSGHRHLRGSAWLLHPQPSSRVPCTVRPRSAAKTNQQSVSARTLRSWESCRTSSFATVCTVICCC